MNLQKMPMGTVIGIRKSLLAKKTFPFFYRTFLTNTGCGVCAMQCSLLASLRGRKNESNFRLGQLSCSLHGWMRMMLTVEEASEMKALTAVKRQRVWNCHTRNMWNAVVRTYFCCQRYVDLYKIKRQKYRTLKALKHVWYYCIEK